MRKIDGTATISIEELDRLRAVSYTHLSAQIVAVTNK